MCVAVDSSSKTEEKEIEVTNCGPLACDTYILVGGYQRSEGHAAFMYRVRNLLKSSGVPIG